MERTFTVAFGFSSSGIGDQLKLLARQADTLVTINANRWLPATSLVLDSPGASQTISVRYGSLVTLTSDKPILVAQFITSLFSGGTGSSGRTQDGQVWR